MSILTIVISIIFFWFFYYIPAKKYGSKRKIGFFGSILVCFAFTPFIGWIIILASPRLAEIDTINKRMSRKKRNLINFRKNSSIINVEDAYKKGLINEFQYSNIIKESKKNNSVEANIQEIQSSEDLTNDNFKFAFPGLLEALEKNISLQKTDNWYVTDIYDISGNILLQVLASNGAQNLLRDSSYQVPAITIHLPFTLDQMDKRNRFLELENSKTFNYSYNSEVDSHDYAKEFLYDQLEEASYFISKLLIDLEGISKSSALAYTTTNYGK